MRERDARISALPTAYHAPLTVNDKQILDTPLSTLVSNVQAERWTRRDVLISYSRQALRAHALTNCLTEVMITSAEVTADASRGIKGPLAGVPVSLKDMIGVEGYDSSTGYSAWVGKPFKQDSPLVRLLKDAGAVPFVKTNIPITLLSFESSNDVFGRTLNPHNPDYSPGGSTGGEAALLALGGSRIGIGTDVAGSVRAPAHYSGIYAVRASIGRFPKSGNSTSMPGQEGVASVVSPMARTLEDLTMFWKAVIDMQPWKYDPSVIPLPWRPYNVSEKKVLRWGIMRDDGLIAPSPACNRALAYTIDALRAAGHEVVEFSPPDLLHGFQVGLRLILADGGKTAYGPFRYGETNDPGFAVMQRVLGLPFIVRKIYSFYLRYIRREPQLASIISCFTPVKDTAEYHVRVTDREIYRAKWHTAWEDAGLDFLLSVPNALPAVPHGGMRDGAVGCGYSFLFNIIDYTAGVLPVTKVDAALDAITPSFAFALRRSNAVMRNIFKMYDPDAMHGLPVGVQVVGQRLEEEKVLTGMEIVRKALEEACRRYEPIPI